MNAPNPSTRQTRDIGHAAEARERSNAQSVRSLQARGGGERRLDARVEDSSDFEVEHVDIAHHVNVLARSMERTPGDVGENLRVGLDFGIAAEHDRSAVCDLNQHAGVGAAGGLAVEAKTNGAAPLTSD